MGHPSLKTVSAYVWPSQGKRQGKGVYTYYSGDVFDGHFDDNKKTGLGRVTYKKGGYS